MSNNDIPTNSSKQRYILWPLEVPPVQPEPQPQSVHFRSLGPLLATAITFTAGLGNLTLSAKRRA